MERIGRIGEEKIKEDLNVIEVGLMNGMGILMKLKNLMKMKIKLIVIEEKEDDIIMVEMNDR